MLKMPLHGSVETAAEALMCHRAVRSFKAEEDVDHYKHFLQLLCTKYFRPIFTNYSASVIDRHSPKKLLFPKPLIPKSLKL